LGEVNFRIGDDVPLSTNFEILRKREIELKFPRKFIAREINMHIRAARVHKLHINFIM